MCSGDIENDHLAIVSQQTAVFSRRDDLFMICSSLATAFIRVAFSSMDVQVGVPVFRGAT